MSMKMVCNRCNKVKGDGEHFNSIRYIRSDSHYEDSEYDLCPECSKLFSIFMDGGEVEDRYKDSKPSAVVIHKLANGTYGIENASEDQAEFDDWLQMVTDDPEKKKNHCGTCAYQWDTAKCPRAKETPGTISCENDAEACDEWVPVSVECGLDGAAMDVEPSMDKEESDSCVKSHKVTCPTTGETVTVPDSKPWVCAGTGRIHNKKRAAMDKEESDLSVTMTKSSSGVYMPDGKPWTTGKKIPKVCKTCRHQNNAGNEDPCCHCNVIDPGEWDSKWAPLWIQRE